MLKVSIFIYFNSKTFSDSSRQNNNCFNPSCGANISTGWDGAAVSIEACGALDPGATPGLDLPPFFFSRKEKVQVAQKEKANVLINSLGVF